MTTNEADPELDAESAVGADPAAIVADPAPAGADPASVVADPARDGMPTGFWRRRSASARGALVVRVLALVVTSMMVVLAVGMWRDDIIINANPVRATATVLTVSALSTGVEFIDSQGVSQRPPGGVLYPGGLVVGRQFLVEYAATDPTLVRVAGRSALNGLIMPGFLIAGAWAIALPLLWWLRRRGRPRPLDLELALALTAKRRRRRGR